jgi:hypothetical protein
MDWLIGARAKVRASRAKVRFCDGRSGEGTDIPGERTDSGRKDENGLGC